MTLSAESGRALKDLAEGAKAACAGDMGKLFRRYRTFIHDLCASAEMSIPKGKNKKMAREAVYAAVADRAGEFARHVIARPRPILHLVGEDETHCETH